MTDFFNEEVEIALRVLQQGGVILYPTDTIWGLGCDAMNEAAIQKIYDIKNRPGSKSFIILLADTRDLYQYIAAPDPAVFDFVEAQGKPTTIILQNAIQLPERLLAVDGSVAIRIVKDDFCRHLIKRLRHPVVSTSANRSGEPSPQQFRDIDYRLKTEVDHVVSWRQDETTAAQPSRIVRWNSDGTHTILRP